MCCSVELAGAAPLPSQFPCAVCKEGVGSNSILCSQCNLWVHYRCSGIKGRLKADPNYICRRCSGLFAEKQSLLVDKIQTGSAKLDVVPTFCYLGDTCGQCGGCNEAITARICSAWKAFRALLPILTNKGIILSTRGYVFRTCVLSVLFYGSETWPVKVDDTQRLSRNVNSMMRWICNIKFASCTSSDELCSRLGIFNTAEYLRWNRLRYYGHLCRMDDDQWPSKVCSFEVVGALPRGRPRQRWSDVIKKDLCSTGIDPTLANDRDGWRNAIHPTTQKNRKLKPSMRRKKSQNDE